MKSYKKITNYNYMENCKCEEYKEQLDTQNSRITCLEYEIEDLKIEKQEFVKKITVIEKENKESKEKIIVLEKDNKELNNRIIILEKDNQELRNKINNSEFEKIITKFITAIQDLNSKNNLEKKIILKKSLYNLRRQRNNNNHYIDEDCNNYEINCRNLYLLNKLKELSNDQITLINNRICKNEDLIGEIIKYLDSNVDNNIQINEDELENIENWWLY
jgi:chromosome segregation ATPase